MKETFKSLQSRKVELEAEANQLQKKKSEVSKALIETENKLRSVNDQIRTLQQNIVVTEHAVLRYLERAGGLIVKDIEKAILTDQLKNSIEALTSGSFPIGNGLYAKVKNKTIVTVFEQK